MENNQTAVSIFNKLADLYQSKFMDVSLYGDTFDSFCSLIQTNNAEILEIACGPGNITRYLLNKRPNFKITGVDLAPNMISLARKNNPEAEFQVMDARDIGKIDKLFDGIVCGFCLPYLNINETAQLISNVSKLLKQGGIFYLSTIEDDYENSGFKKGSSGDEIFMHYYTSRYLSDELKNHGFSIIDKQYKKYPAPGGTE